MVAPRIRVSSYVSEVTKRSLDRCAQSLGTNRSRLIEMALLHHLQAIEAPPPESVPLAARPGAQERPPGGLRGQPAGEGP